MKSRKSVVRVIELEGRAGKGWLSEGAPPEQLESSWLVQHRQAAREIPGAKIVLALWVDEHTERKKKYQPDSFIRLIKTWPHSHF